MTKSFEFYQGKINLSNGPGCYKITEDPLWLLSVLPLDKSSYLEVGCATGVISLILKLKNPKAQITAIDIQECMIKQAKHHAKSNNINNIKFKKQDLFNLNKQNKYDCVFSNPPFFNECCCNIKDQIKEIACKQPDITSFINKQLTLVKDNGTLCFIGHISTREEIIRAFKGKVDLKEISLISTKSKPAKRFIYIINKNNKIDFNQFELKSFDNKVRKEILFLYQTLNKENLNKLN